MHILIDEGLKTPIYQQIIDQVKKAVAEGELTPGVQLPSIRQIANDADVNPNTVAKAFKILERDEVIESKGYKGSFIKNIDGQKLQENMHAKVKDELNAAIEKLRQIGAIDSEIRNSFNALMKSSKD